MNMDMIWRRNGLKHLLLSVTKTCETLIKQTHRKPQETFEFKPTQPRKIFSSKPSISTEGTWIIEVTSLEVYSSNFYITEENHKSELYTDTFHELSFTETKDDLEGTLDFPNISQWHLQDEMIGPRIIKAIKKLETEKRHTFGYFLLLLGYVRSPYRHFEIYLRIVFGLHEDDFN